MKVTKSVADPVLLQLLKLSARKKKSVVAACDRTLRYTHLFNAHPRFAPEESVGRTDEELADPEAVRELVELKRDVIRAGREIQRRVHIRIDGEDRIFDVTAEPIHDDSGRATGVATAALDVTPALDVQALLRALSRRLEAESHEITERWHEDLSYRLSVRPQNIFPTDELLDGMPQVVAWLARSIMNGDTMAAEDTESLREIAGHWRRGGYSVEESLIHVRVLSDLLLDAAAEATTELGAGVDPAAGIEAARRLCRALSMVQVVLVATYRDAEEERFTDFGATLAHEIRGHLGSALTGVQLVEVLRRDDPSGKLDEVLGRVEHALEQANAVVHSVQSLSQAQRDDHQSWTWKSLREIVEEIVAERAGGRHVRIDIADDLSSAAVPAEPVHLILHNLVENAVKYSNPDADRRWVRVHTARDPDDGHLVVHVGDNGLGIPEPEQERIFLRFRRGQEATGDGFGLGLAIVRETARKFGGRILLESEPGEGSTFSLTIPDGQIRD